MSQAPMLRRATNQKTQQKLNTKTPELLQMIRVLTTLYNSEQYIAQCIHSIQSQNHKIWHCYIMDDLSTDNSVSVAKSVIDDRFTIIQNKEKLYQCGNYHEIIKQFEDDDICIEVDGDDWLPDPEVFSRILKAHESAWITWGSCIYFGINGTHIVHQAQGDPLTIRRTNWSPVGCRSWRVFLWRKIRIEDLMDNGQFWQVAGDLAFMYPMIEMSGKRAKFLTDLNYCYNANNPLCNHFKNRELQLDNDKKIRSKEPYLPRLFL